MFLAELKDNANCMERCMTVNGIVLACLRGMHRLLMNRKSRGQLIFLGLHGKWLLNQCLMLKINDIALPGKSSQSYEASLAIWDHTVLPVTRHK